MRHLRLKNESYIRNTVLLYRRKIDQFLEQNPQYCRASYGRCIGGFEPNPKATFNRDYTTLFIDGKRGKWHSKDGAKYLGEFIGTITSTGTNRFGQLHFTYKAANSSNTINNGDGLCFVTPKGEILGARANTCNGTMVATTEKLSVAAGSKLYRNYNILFEKEMEKNPPRRTILVNLEMSQTSDGYSVKATTEEGITATYNIEGGADIAQNPSLAIENISKQLGKSAGIFSFTVTAVKVKDVPFFAASALNGIRREIAALLEKAIEEHTAQRREESSRQFIEKKAAAHRLPAAEKLTYLANCANSVSRKVYTSLGAKSIAPAYELQEAPQAELMRTKYCIKYELGLCPNCKAKWGDDKSYRDNLGKVAFTEPLYLLNGKNRLELKFDCKNCEMLVIG